MAAKASTQTVESGTDPEDRYPAWVYHIPALLLIFGGIALIALASM